MTTHAMRSFASGEISPSMYSRADTVKYATGLRTCLNNIVLRYGGLSNRPGTGFVAETADSSRINRLIPFVFNDEQAYVLEFGHEYVRVVKNGVLLSSSTLTITDITQANPGVATSVAHGLANSQELYLYGIEGMTELNNRQVKVSNVTADTFEIQDMDSVNIDTSTLNAYTSGGSADVAYEITTTYQEADLLTLNFVQSADIITITHHNYPPSELSRTADTSWSLTDIDFDPTIPHPVSLSVAKGPSGSKTFKYKATSIDADSGEESLAAIVAASVVITGITKADPAQVSTTGHTFEDGDIVEISSIVGMDVLNGKQFRIIYIDANDFELDGVDSSLFDAYVSGGSASATYYKITSAGTPSTTSSHLISWTAVSGASEYNIYKETNGVYGQIGVAGTTSFNDINITPNTTYLPPTAKYPFLGDGNYPATVTYIQQRQAFANTLNDPEKVFLSRTGNFKNFTTSSSSVASDAISFTMAGREVNAVKAMLDLGSMVIMTTGGEWAAKGDSAGILKPTDINTKQYSYNGSGEIQPILIDTSAIYQQARGSIIRDLGYNYQVEGYSGNDLTLFSSHLFDKYTVVDWAYQQVPHSILWCVRSDGALLGMTYVKSQEVMAWHRHELGGDVERVVVIPEGNEDVPYVTIKRTINGATRRYVERLSTRSYTDILDAKVMDSHLSYDGRNTGAITMTLSGGTDWLYDEDLTLTADASYFSSSDIGNQIQMDYSGDPLRCTIKAFTSDTVVTVNTHKTVPVSLQDTATTDWAKAVDEIGGLWHIEGENVSVFADGFVVASPNNASYETITVEEGRITLDKPYSVVHVGLAYISDIETLDIDSPQGETLQDKFKSVSEVSMYLEETRGLWVGGSQPTGDDPLEGLTELKIRDEEDYDSPVSLVTDNVNINIMPEWNSNGRVFVRQVDPVPMSVLSINPAGKFPFGG